MKANEFIKKHGWGYAKERLDYCKNARLVGMEIELKRLVESHELVESCGGLDSTRKEAHKNCFDFNAPLLKAILDVESCQ